MGDSRGAAAVEFALVIIPLLLFLFGIFEFGRLLWTREALQSAAIAGARCMGIGQTECTTSGSYDAQKTAAYISGQGVALLVPLTASNVLLDDAATCSGVGGFSEVTINFTFQTAVPQLLGALADGIPLSASACFPNQGNAAS